MEGNIPLEIAADYIRPFSFSATELLTPDSIGVILIKAVGLSSFIYLIRNFTEKIAVEPFGLCWTDITQ